ncbi:MAG: hypothetical protein JST00_17605 [Deltaproteobacteria bacterium]|nr:hypothetical protein [Deltaproteobacteria bacterium]
MRNKRRWVLSWIAGGLATTALYACATSGDTLPGDDPDAADPSADASRDGTFLDTGTKTDTGTDAGNDAKADAPIDAPVDAPKDVFEAGPSPFDEAGTFMVVRVGQAGGAALSAASVAAFIEERRFKDGVVEQTIALPTAAAAPQHALTLRGTGTTEGTLSRSDDGAFVVLAGYDAPPGTASVATTTAATVARVVGRVTKAGVVDTSTALTGAYDEASPRAAATADGTAFWVSGDNGTGNTGGIYYAELGQGGLQIFDTPGNLRAVGVFGAQLYATTQSGAAGNTLRLFAVGTGTPTTAGQTGTQLAGIPDTVTPHGLVLLDRDPGVAGVDTLYAADTRALTAGGGIQKWKLGAGGTWTLVTTFKKGLTGAPVNVAAKPIGTSVAVVCATLDNPSKIVRFLDDGVALDPTGTTLGTAASPTQFRGVAITPD